MLQDDRLTQDDLRQVEARLDAAVQAMNARFSAANGCFARSAQLSDIEQELLALDRRSSARCGEVEARLAATKERLNEIQLELVVQIDHARRDLARVILLGLLGTASSAALLCLATILLAL